MVVTESQWKTIRQLLLGYEQAVPAQLHPVENVIKDVETANGIKTYVVSIRWLDHAHPHPRDVDNPQMWPPEVKSTLTSTSPITTVMIQDEVARLCRDPIAIHATHDPTGRYGWKKLEDW